MRETLGRDRVVEADGDRDDRNRPSIRKRLDEVMNKPRDRLDLQEEREVDEEKELGNGRDTEREGGWRLKMTPRKKSSLGA